MPDMDFIRRYAGEVAVYWNSVAERVNIATERKIALPFSLKTFESDYHFGHMRCVQVAGAFFPSDDEYQEIRSSHTKAKAYDSSLQAATGGQDPVLKPPPGSIDIPPAGGPETPDKPGNTGPLGDVKEIVVYALAGLVIFKLVDSFGAKK